MTTNDSKYYRCNRCNASWGYCCCNSGYYCCRSIPGPTGPQGSQGETGATGAAGADGLPGATGAAGADGMPGATGATGADGMPGATGPTGAASTVPGPTGPTGMSGPIAAFLPFCTVNQSAPPISTDAEGNPAIVQFCGFGYGSYNYIYLKPDEWSSGTITLSESASAMGPTYYGASFVMPNNGIVRKIYLTIGSKMGNHLSEGVVMFPFACLAAAKPTSLVNEIVYSIIPETMTYTEPYIGEGTVPKFSIRNGYTTNLDVFLEEGSLVAVVLGWRGENVEEEQYGAFSIFGGIYLE